MDTTEDILKKARWLTREGFSGRFAIKPLDGSQELILTYCKGTIALAEYRWGDVTWKGDSAFDGLQGLLDTEITGETTPYGEEQERFLGFMKEELGGYVETPSRFTKYLEEIVAAGRSAPRHLYIASLICLVALFIAEVSIAYFSPVAGVVIDACLLLFLVMYALVSGERYTPMFISLAFLPLMRIISLSIPFEMDLIYRIALVSMILLISVKLFLNTFMISVRRIGLVMADVPVEIKAGIVGFTVANKPFQFLVALTGPLFGFIEYLVLGPLLIMSMTPAISAGNIEVAIAPKLLGDLLTLQLFLLLAVILVFFTGFFEELLFRGLIQSHSMSTFGRRYGIAYPALLFAVMSIGWGSWLEVIFLLPVGLFYGYVFYKTRCLYGIGLSHGLSNLTMLLLASSF